MDIHTDKDFWTTLKWPAAPNLEDYKVFEQYCSGRVLLLGSTKLLLPLCTEAWDLEPKYDNPKIQNKDWFTLENSITPCKKCDTCVKLREQGIR